MSINLLPPKGKLLAIIGIGIGMLGAIGLWWWQTSRTFRQIDQQGESTIGQIWQRSREQASELIGRFPSLEKVRQPQTAAVGGGNATTRQRDNGNVSVDQQAIEAIRKRFTTTPQPLPFGPARGMPSQGGVAP